MKAMPTDDKLFGKGRIREDGSVIHPIYLFQVKSPDESKDEWDYFKSGCHPAGRGGIRSAEQGLPPGAWLKGLLG